MQANHPSALALIGALGNKAQQGKIVMIEPRRLAAKAAATRLASCLMNHWANASDSPSGRTADLSSTRVEVITDGLFLRRLQSDLSLEGVECVLFDEFHERRRDADLAFTFCGKPRPCCGRI